MLQRVAWDVLAIPITTVASESSFSTSGRLVSPHRSRLRPSTMEALMCAQSWLLNEIRANCPKKTEAYCQTIERDYDDSDEENNLRDEGANMTTRLHGLHEWANGIHFLFCNHLVPLF
ncbi:uncharacterized protein LOC110939209 [Helianthus annuus]|uniref:uncharacterized protein LOC110939209 n=1 Tax=Helianthus annuus TaxID=4232 RepID=UPI000B8FBBAB|nr:uncharacterized protein LOC110939209 [Helianthus annuus]